MTRLAIWNAESLLGREIKDGLAQRRDLWDDLRLLSDASDGQALVTDMGDAAAFVQPATKDTLEGVDLVFYCVGSGDEAEIPDLLPAQAATIVVAGDTPVPGIPPMVAEVNTRALGIGGAPSVVSSAHPSLVALAHLLHPLLQLGLESCTASLVLPGSTRGQEDIDQLLAQTRSILAFQPQPADEVFGCQLAFNLVPGPLSGGRLAEPLRDILGTEGLELAIQSSIGGVFHGLAVGAHVRLGSRIDEARVHEALEASAVLEFAGEPQTLGPVDAAGSATMLLSPVETSTAPDSYWLRAVMDNLTLGGALNAIAIAEAILDPRAAGEPDCTM